MLEKEKLRSYREELETELANILDYWMKNTLDNVYGGFVGQINNQNKVVPLAPKGSVLNARILWSFSAAYNLTQDNRYVKYAVRAYKYIAEHFIDKDFGGVYWTVDAAGKPLDTKKQVYAIAFNIYALSEFCKATKNMSARDLAIDMYRCLVKHAYDKERTGYYEAFSREWEPIEDLRLSDKDANEKKTMNTHLHVLEAFTNLYRIWPDEELYSQLIILIQNFTEHIVDSESFHLKLFFDEKWNSRSAIVSYGHDIEAAWLLLEAAEATKNEALIDELRHLAVKMAAAAGEGLDSDGSLFYEYGHNKLIKEKHWWVQAEAMVGFFNAWQVSGDECFIEKSINSWRYVKDYILDKENGEWFWGRDADGQAMNEDKVGLWKCPYHNSRACIEIIKRAAFF